MSWQALDVIPSVAPPRRASVHSSSGRSGFTKSIDRPHKPTSISTDYQRGPSRNSAGSSDINSAPDSSITTPTKRPLSIRRKAVAMLSSQASPSYVASPLVQTPVAANGQPHMMVKGDRDPNRYSEKTQSRPADGGHSNNGISISGIAGRSNSTSRNNRADEGAKHRTLVKHPRDSMGKDGIDSSNASPSFATITNNLPPTNSDTQARTGGSTNTDNGSHNATFSDVTSQVLNQQQQQSHQLQGKVGSNMGQKFGDLLSIGGSLLGSKKRGSDTSVKAGGTSPMLDSSSSASSPASRDASGPSFSKKDFSTPPITPKISLLSKVFGSQQQVPQQHQRHCNSMPIDSPRDYDSVLRGGAPWISNDESKIAHWEMNKSVPSSGYEDEAFALWIRPNIQARTVISGADVEKAENSTLDISPVSREEKKKKYRPELEHVKVLEEVLDFSIIVLMQASASLYPFIASAHSKSIPFNIPWKPLQYEDRGCKHYNVKTLKDYQDYIMADIGCAVQAMIEIYDQQERPYSHPDNMGRDTKPQAGAKFPPVVLPPNRPRLNKKNMSNCSVNANARSSSMRPTTTSPSAVPSVVSSGISSTSLVTKKHRRHSSTPGGRPSISSIISSFKQSLPSPISLQSPQQGRSGTEGYCQPLYASYPDGTPFSSAFPGRSIPLSYTQADVMDQPRMSFSFNDAGGSTGSTLGSFLPQSIQTMFNSFRSNTVNAVAHGGNSLFNNSPGTPTFGLSRQEERRQQMEHRWRVDIMRRKAHLRAWACRCFLDLYHYSLTIKTASLEDDFKDLYRIVQAIVDIDANATEKSHDSLVSILAQAREQELEPFQLRYSQYKTRAPTGSEIHEANQEVIKRFEAEYSRFNESARPTKSLVNKDDGGASMRQALDGSVAPLRQLAARGIDSARSSIDARDNNGTSLSSDGILSSAYDNMEFYGLQVHAVWEPLLDRLTKFDTTHHELDARNIFQFLRRMSLYSPVVTDAQHLLSDETRDEMLAVLWVLEKCVQERPDYQQSPTWFRLSSSATAVQAVYNAGGVIPYLKELRYKDPKAQDPILTVHPVTLTGYFKRLLKESGGLLLKETTGLFVELARPATDNGDLNRGHVFLRISRVMEHILESSPKDMELDAFALSKMVQVVELSGVLDLKALRRWNGAWSAIILGYM
ncbi:hypothetical protein BGZ98_004910 [Dissophora globulifera]|nr:hypothetical protein BGZ98_004910 [Dissophora globulifera]